MPGPPKRLEAGQQHELVGAAAARGAGGVSAVRGSRGEPSATRCSSVCLLMINHILHNFAHLLLSTPPSLSSVDPESGRMPRGRHPAEVSQEAEAALVGSLRARCSTWWSDAAADVSEWMNCV